MLFTPPNVIWLLTLSKMVSVFGPGAYPPTPSGSEKYVSTASVLLRGTWPFHWRVSSVMLVTVMSAPTLWVYALELLVSNAESPE